MTEHIERFEITPTYEAQVVNRSKVMATLCGRDAEALKARAHRYAAAMNWHRAIVTVSQVQVTAR